MRGRCWWAVPFLSILLLAACGQTGIVTSPGTAGSPAPTFASGLALPTAPLSVYAGSVDGTVAALDAASGIMRWRSTVASSGSTTTVGALADGVVYVSVTDANQHPLTTVLAALRATNGSVLWHTTRAGTAAVVATSPGAVISPSTVL